jgi:hypothetical protein
VEFARNLRSGRTSMRCDAKHCNIRGDGRTILHCLGYHFVIQDMRAPRKLRLEQQRGASSTAEANSSFNDLRHALVQAPVEKMKHEHDWCSTALHSIRLPAVVCHGKVGNFRL